MVGAPERAALSEAAALTGLEAASRFSLALTHGVEEKSMYFVSGIQLRYKATVETRIIWTPDCVSFAHTWY